MAESNSDRTARERRQLKRRRELADAGKGDQSGDATRKISYHPVLDPKVNPIPS